MTQFLVPDTRKLESFGHVPAGHLIKWLDNIDTGPRFGAGEFALIDAADRTPQHGELYLIRWRSNGLEVVQALSRRGHGATPNGVTWWTRGVHSIDRRGLIEIPGSRYVDGPRGAEQFQQALIGRVVGVYQAVAKQAGGRGQ